MTIISLGIIHRTIHAIITLCIRDHPGEDKNINMTDSKAIVVMQYLFIHDW